MEEGLNQQLLDLIEKFFSSQSGNNIKEKIDNYYLNSKYDEPKKEIAEALKYIVGENGIESFLLKDTICQILINMLNKKDFVYGDLLKEFTNSKSLKIQKTINIAKSIAYITATSEYKFFFLMLNEQRFTSLNKILQKFGITIYKDYKDFNDKIDEIDVKQTIYLANKVDLSQKDISNLLADINDVTKYIQGSQKPQETKSTNTSISKKKKKNNKKNINENNIISISKDTNNLIKEKEKENKLNEQRNERIFKLINKGVNINVIKEINYENFFINNDDYKECNSESDLLIDDYQIKDKKTHVFSPISLIVNNFKHEFEKNDFEIFNKDNIYVEVFGKYLEEIIQKLNNYINNGEDEDYIVQNDIKIGCYKTHYYLCCKFNELFKQNYYNDQSNLENRNCLIPNLDNKEEIEILNIKTCVKEEKNLCPKEKESSIKSKEDAKEEKIYSISSAKNSRDNYRNLVAHNFENYVKEFLCESIKCESFHNIIFFFNMKIPKKFNNNIIMKSVVLTFNKKSDMNLYGFREIDICLKSKSSKEISNNILNNNLVYENINGKFKKKAEQPIDVSLKENSIIFCEVKNTFPYTLTIGDEKFDIIKLKQNKKDYDSININTATFTYLDQIDNLQKKSKIFLDFFLKQNILTKNDVFHIIFLYDDSNIDGWNEEKQIIENNIDGFFDSKDFTDFKNVIFQIAYFNKEQYIIYKNEKKDNKIKKLEKKGKEDYETIKELKEKGKKDDEAIQELKQKGKKYDETIKELKEKGKKDDETIKELKEKGKKDDEIIKELRQKRKEDDQAINELKQKGKKDDETIKKLKEELEKFRIQLNKKNNNKED